MKQLLEHRVISYAYLLSIGLVGQNKNLEDVTKYKLGLSLELKLILYIKKNK